MFETCPRLPDQPHVSFARVDISVSIPQHLRKPAEGLVRSLQLITTLRDLQSPGRSEFLDRAAANALRKSIATLVLNAAQATEDPNLVNVLQARGRSFLDNEYDAAALTSAMTQGLEMEFVAGPIPAWRFKSKPRLFGGSLSLVDAHVTKQVAALKEYVPQALTKLSTTLGVILEQTKDEPVYSVSDLIAVAGESRAHPIHIASFYPEDEGVLNVTNQKTIVHQNLYARRFMAVSAPAFASRFGTNLDHWSIDHVREHLLVWLKGHDIGHTVFDHHCKLLQGIHPRKRYVLQELLADLFGLMLANEYFGKNGTCTTADHAAAIYVAELVRYASRDRRLFPDAASAVLQLVRMHERDIIISDGVDPVFQIDNEAVLPCLDALFGDVARAVIKGKAGVLELMIEREALVDESLPAWLALLANKRCLPSEVDPQLLTADQLVEQADNIALRTVRSNSPDSNWKCRRV